MMSATENSTMLVANAWTAGYNALGRSIPLQNLCTCVPKEAYAPKVSSIEAQITRQRQQQYIRPSNSPGSLVARDTDSESQGSTRDGQAGIEDNSEDRWDDTLDYDDQGRNEDVHNWLHGLPSQDAGQEEKELEQHVWAVDQEGTENEQLFLHSMHSYILARTRLQLMVSAFQKGLFELRRGSMLEELQRILDFHENDRFPQNWAKPLEPPGASSTGDMTPGAKRPRPEDVASRAQR
ncbi:MAG: hypothetical protein M1825_002843 [Sarcosagium campestre]|nr:MAG: hypothetical protein M1825_002843 [Sarcosagium campestre]